MSVRIVGEVVMLEGPCRVEDAEALTAALLASPARIVDLAGAHQIHAAVVQALLAFRPAIAGMPADPFAADWLVPLLVSELLASDHRAATRGQG